MNNRWYHTDDWYAPLTRAEEEGEREDTDDKKSRRRVRIISAILAALLLLNAAAFAFSPVVRSWRASAFSGGGGGEEEARIPEEFPDQFRDFFKDYYTEATSDASDVRIPAGEVSEAYEMELLPSAGQPLSLQQLYEKCAPSVVGVAGYEDGKPGYSWGTGVVLTSDGLILTNTHVISSSDTAKVFLPGREEAEALLVGADAISDLAVLKVEATNLRPAEFGESAALTVGEAVAAIGNPLGSEFTGTLTNGIISAIDRDVTYNGRSMTLLQTNTALNEGNSGGALFNMFGQVVGITNMKMMSVYSSIEGIGFAIPSGTVQSVVSSLVSYGEVRGRPSIGITVGEIPENVNAHYELPEGLYVASVVKGSDAEKQGIREGDIVVAVNGQPVTTTEEVNTIKKEFSVGDSMSFTLWRDGTELEVSVTLMDTNDLYS